MSKNETGSYRKTKTPVPRKRVRGEVQGRLVIAAARLFAEKGYDGVAVDEIVAVAGVNKRMVYHYFGSKDGIYRAAVDHVFSDLQEMEAGLIEAYGKHSDPADGIRNLVSVYFSFLETHPDFVRILQWENLAGGKHLGREQEGMSKTSILEHLESLLQEGVASGLFRRDLDPRLVLSSLIGLSLIYFSNRYTMGKAIGLNFNDPKVLRLAAQHAQKMFLAGLTAPVPPAGTKRKKG